MSILKRHYLVDAIITKDGLEPAMDDLPIGVNLKAIRYIPNEKKAKKVLVGIWGSNHPAVANSITEADLDKVKGRGLQRAENHANKPDKLGVAIGEYVDGEFVKLDSDE